MPRASDADPPPAPRPLSLVRFEHDLLPKKFHRKYPFIEGRAYVYFGEIPNMAGHCVVMDHRTGQFFSGYHTENFTEIAEDET